MVPCEIDLCPNWLWYLFSMCFTFFHKGLNFFGRYEGTVILNTFVQRNFDHKLIMSFNKF